uniref:Uncharacterized protein n=1 Tax=Pipistrellus kuhlii TaxID=59472 RepID=A0A7J7SFQ6_PIPKU|nr:hypothetical protein mPipKuh1_009990 [Pipistrellus kuhlii]
MGARPSQPEEVFSCKRILNSLVHRGLSPRVLPGETVTLTFQVLSPSPVYLNAHKPCALQNPQSLSGAKWNSERRGPGASKRAPRHPLGSGADGRRRRGPCGCGRGRRGSPGGSGADPCGRRWTQFEDRPHPHPPPRDCGRRCLLSWRNYLLTIARSN